MTNTIRVPELTDEEHPFFYTRLLGLRVKTIEELIRKVEKGFSYSALETFQQYLKLPTAALAQLVQIKPRTLARRRDMGRLEIDESDRLLRAARVLGKAVRLYEGDLEAARNWLQEPALALGNRTPLAIRTTEIGAQTVEDLIGRLEQGVYS